MKLAYRWGYSNKTFQFAASEARMKLAYRWGFSDKTFQFAVSESSPQRPSIGVSTKVKKKKATRFYTS